jgi:hypothetical protein
MLASEVISPKSGSDHSTIYAQFDMSNTFSDTPGIKRIWYYDRDNVDALNDHKS